MNLGSTLDFKSESPSNFTSEMIFLSSKFLINSSPEIFTPSLAQYFLKTEGRHADLEFTGLTKIYQNMQIVNVAIANRLRSTSMSDSAINAIVILDNFAKHLPYAIEKSLKDLRHLFLPFLT